VTSLALHKLLGRCLMPGATPERLFVSDFPWPELLAIANRHLLTPALNQALCEKAALASIPADVRDYLATLDALNAERNQRLAAQAAEVIAALNRRDIEPLLLKGAAALFEAPCPARMIGDLDLVVALDEGDAAVAALAALGYRRVSPPSPHTRGDFARPQDVGAIDLHVALLAEPDLLPRAAVRSVRQRQGALSFHVLSPTDRALHLILHDLVQDHGYFDGALNLRHLHELALAMRADAVAWDNIAAHLAQLRLGAALDIACAAAAFLFAVPNPLPARGLLARVLLWRALLRLRYPEGRRAWEILGNTQRSLAWYRLADRGRSLPRLRQAIAYVRRHRARTAERLLHIVFHRRA
jgi:hypothetical protein